MQQAAELAAWLITKKHTKRNVAVIIGCNKFNLPFSKRAKVSKLVTELIKHPKNQMRLI